MLFKQSYMIDNFDIIKNFIENNVTMEYGDFLFVQILKRRKENPELKKDVHFKCPKCSYEEDITIKGMQNFFV